MCGPAAHSETTADPKATPKAASAPKTPEAPAAKPAPPKIAPALPLDAETKELLEELRKRYADLKSWSAAFEQEKFSPGLGRGSFSMGELKYSAPNRFLYRVQFPENSDVICDGKEAWQILYRKGRDKPAFVRHFRDITELGVEKYFWIFRGPGGSDKEAKKFIDKFNLKAKRAGDGFFFEIQPRDSSEELSRITLYFAKSQVAPQKATLVDGLGGTLTLTIQKSTPFTPSADDFKPVFAKDSEIEEQ